MGNNSTNTIEWHPLYGNPAVVDFLRKIANDARDKESLSDNPLYLPPELTPPIGKVYSWGTYSICGEMHYTNIKRLEQTGHNPVPPERHPELYSDGSVTDTISRKGLVLVESNSKAANDLIKTLIQQEREEAEAHAIYMNNRSIFARLIDKVKSFF
jgi:hypothetical protein